MGERVREDKRRERRESGKVKRILKSPVGLFHR